jgi:hypothetical protein
MPMNSARRLSIHSIHSQRHMPGDLIARRLNRCIAIETNPAADIL